LNSRERDEILPGGTGAGAGRGAIGGGGRVLADEEEGRYDNEREEQKRAGGWE